MHDLELDQLLKATNASSCTPMDFQRNVWCRIETAENRGWKANARQMMERYLGLLAMPRFAIATCTAVALVGALMGMQTAAPNSTQEANYVQSINPFNQTSHR